MKKIYLIGIIILGVLIIGGTINYWLFYTPIKNTNLDFGENIVNISKFSYNPMEITIKKGETITWINYDSIKHSVTSEEDLFNSGLLSKEDTWNYTFNEQGTYNYYCIPHPFMQAKVIVE
jgi:amicyanin